MHLKWLHVLREYQMKVEYIYLCPHLNGRKLFVLYLTSRTRQKEKKIKFSNLLLYLCCNI